MGSGRVAAVGTHRERTGARPGEVPECQPSGSAKYERVLGAFRDASRDAPVDLFSVGETFGFSARPVRPKGDRRAVAPVAGDALAIQREAARGNWYGRVFRPAVAQLTGDESIPKDDRSER
jgi:hypothetical protein